MNATTTLIRHDEDSSRKRIGLLQGFKGKPKAFYGYMCSVQTVKDNIGLSVLKKDDGDDCVIQHLHIHAFC